MKRRRRIVSGGICGSTSSFSCSFRVCRVAIGFGLCLLSLYSPL